MSFLNATSSLHRLNTPKDIEGFTCGDKDLDDFFTNDCFAYVKQLLGKTYYYKLTNWIKNHIQLSVLSLLPMQV